MTDDKVPDLLLAIKQQTASQEILFESLIKVEAMVEIVLARDFSDFSTEKMYTYMWAVSDLIEKARMLSEDLLNGMSKITPLLMRSEISSYSL